MNQESATGKIGFEGKRARQIICIDRRDACYLRIGSIRAAVRGGEDAKRTMIPLCSVADRIGAQFVQDECTGVDETAKTLKLKSGRSQPFDVLVWCTGSRSYCLADLPANCDYMKDMIAHLNAMSAVIGRAQNLLIIGGGPTGCELAGEIRAFYPDKKIAIITASDKLLSSSIAPLSKKFVTTVQRKLESREIKVMLNERVVDPSNKLQAGEGYMFNDGKPITVRCASGTTIECDLILWAVPYDVNSAEVPSECPF